MIVASILLIVALYCNIDARNSLALTFIVGASYFFPFDIIHSRDLWYASVIISELIVLLSALALKTRASLMVIVVCAMLELNHINGYFFGGHNPDSPYHVVVKYLEYIEIVALILFSSKIINKIKGLLCQVLKPSSGY